MTRRNQGITPHMRNYRRSPLRSNNSIELSMIIYVIDVLFMEYESPLRCLGDEMVDTRDLKSRAKERGGSSPLQGIILRILTK